MNNAKERPILFSAPMVRAILSGQKTVTRRAVRHQPDVPVTDAIPCRNFPHGPATIDWYWRPKHGHLNGVPSAGWDFTCPYGQPGDRLWVRETLEKANGVAVGYPADGSWLPCTPWMWKRNKVPSIHMPRWAARIQLEITDVRVERLQDGDGETAFQSRYIAEGINRIHQGDGEYAFHPFKTEPGPGSWTDPIGAWRELWVSVNGAESWNANPWVWVVEFKRLTP